MKSLRTELKRINENNSKLTDIEIFERSLISWESKILRELQQEIFNQDINEKDISKVKNSSVFYDRRQTTEIISFKVKHYIDIKKLEEWIKDKLDNQSGFDLDYVMRNFTNFDKKNEAFIKFKEHLNDQENLKKGGFINTRPYTFNIIPISQTKNKFNEDYFDEKKNVVQWQNQQIKKILNNEIERETFLEKYWDKSWPVDETLIELLLRGDQTLEISYEELEVDITSKGLEYLNNSWIARNGNWFWPLLVSIVPIIISIIAIALKQN